MSVKVLLVDDHAIIREGLRSLLEKQPDMEVVADVDDGRRAVEMVRELSPDVVIMDVTMPRLGGIEATRQITGESPSVKVIALSIHSKRRFVADMLQAGAAGYILKECLFDELVQAIHAVCEGGRYLSPSITDVVVNDYVKRLSSDEESPLRSLTGREREVLQLVAEGKSSAQIGDLLYLSPKTVDTYRSRLMQKLGIQDLASLVKFAVRQGLVPLE